MDTLAVFRSRGEALRLYGALRKNGIACATVNTPSKLKMGCGISVVFPRSYAEIVLSLVKNLRLTSFVGTYRR